MINGKSPEEIDLANRRFAAEQILKLGVREGADYIGEIKELHGFLSEAPALPENPTGFSPA